MLSDYSCVGAIYIFIGITSIAYGVISIFLGETTTGFKGGEGQRIEGKWAIFASILYILHGSVLLLLFIFRERLSLSDEELLLAFGVLSILTPTLSNIAGINGTIARKYR